MTDDYGTSLEEAFKKELRGRQRITKPFSLCTSKYMMRSSRSMLKNLKSLAYKRPRRNMSALSEEKEKIESELVLAEAKAADVKVPYIDWYKLNEPQMFD
uniref:Uncharacterized protein n=1 Tax=Brassica oleracea var. oleracea TaxID=109376 RepID=A0A0D2ZY17_BRAOL